MEALELQACRDVEQAKPVTQRSLLSRNRYHPQIFAQSVDRFDNRDDFAETSRIGRILSALPPRFPANSRGLAHEVWISNDRRSIFLR